MPFLTSANIACGFHGGDPHVIRRTVSLALQHGVGIGAHVAFPDLIGFGRRNMNASGDEVRDDLVYQIGALTAFTRAKRLQHVKPHGALYTTIVDSDEHAQAVCEAVAELGPDVILLMPPAVAEQAARAGVPFVPEGYVDLDYDTRGKLVLERVKQLLLAAPPARAQVLCFSIVNAIAEFSAGAPLSDDRTALALVRTPDAG